MRNRAISPVATILSVLVLVFVASPAQAGPVAYSEVVHVMGSLRSGGQSQELRLRSISQDGGTHINGALVSPSKSSTDASSSPSDSEPSSLISTTAGLQEGQQGEVEIIQEGDVTGTVCDCGEFVIPGKGFPAWLALGGIPLVCVLVDCSPNDKPPPPGDNPPPPEIPEPATIFLLGSGLAALGAKARRRYSQSKSDNEVPTSTEV
ncbi:MAG: PEP-CTERM sorting domain-containing protein [Acidobacteria bacterium]|nr:PEP-CTERM sorting domain-containing protein [Acidobacteriota bacterium]